MVIAAGDGIGRRVVIGVSEADEDAADPDAFGIGLAVSAEDDVGLTAFLAEDLHIGPIQVFADAGAEGFRDRFLRGEAGCVMKRGAFLRGALGPLSFSEDAVTERVTMALQGIRDAIDLHHVDADADQSHGPSG
jgi:hypothetical protein